MSESKVVNLVDAEVPADQGLAALGMLMRLGGNVLAALGALMAVNLLAAASGMHGNALLLTFIVVGLSIMRSLIHSQAGSGLIHGDQNDGGRISAVHRYIKVALAQSIIVAVIFKLGFHLPVRVALATFVGLALWPAALAILLRLPRFHRFTDGALPIPEDKGFEGAAILMTVFGACGTIGTGTALVLLMKMLSSQELQSGPVVMILLCLVLLVIRSSLHLMAGISGLRETSIDRSVELANRYTNFGIISGFCAGGAMLLFVMMSAAISVDGMAAVVGVTWMLLAWPMIVRRFFSDRQFGDILAGDNAPIHRRSPDAGLTWLGWLLLGYAMLQGSALAFQLIAGSSTASPMLSAMTSFGQTGMRSQWFTVGVLVMQGWAGFELVRMSPQARSIATAFGVIAVGVTLYTNWPLMKGLASMHLRGSELAMVFGPLALALVIPVATVVLVNRKIAPTARARYRTKE